ncbi:tRNA threonylcarbamoyladenosine dehydratase [Vaginisenegalia massiliensis]|uniref:tRNA threonylcarbamoyladenosine dehydratase n=1 Tax=Vaginisenegalia massiliensis TaxID=2058294 RepID=UPI000F547792|nr:tRNA threonylcarbamoyladenosine dehydratase [Vaginisenegalia massiliensis]
MQKDIQNERYSRLRLILKDQGLSRLLDSTVMVLGLGGVGSACAEALARGGVGNLILIDRDIIEASNINRQALAFTSTVGKVKTEVMEQMVAQINPDCLVYTQQSFLNKDNIDQILGSFPRPDYVIDCIDTVSPKLMVAQWCGRHGIPLLSAMGAANKLDPQFLRFAYIEDTVNCRLSKVMRRECKQRGIQQLEVLFSTELTQLIENPESSAKADTLGSMSYMPPIMGQMLAGKVIRRLASLENYTVTPRVIDLKE